MAGVRGNTSLETKLEVNEQIKDPNWLAGFVDGDGCFAIEAYTSPEYKLGTNVGLSFQIVQHSRDKNLLESFASYLGCGRYVSRRNEEGGAFVVKNFNDIESKIIPFFDKYPLKSNKAKDFEDFKLAAQIIKEKRHLTQEGLDEILQIRSGMNRGREC